MLPKMDVRIDRSPPASVEGKAEAVTAMESALAFAAFLIAKLVLKPDASDAERTASVMAVVSAGGLWALSKLLTSSTSATVASVSPLVRVLAARSLVAMVRADTVRASIQSPHAAVRRGAVAAVALLEHVLMVSRSTSTEVAMKTELVNSGAHTDRCQAALC